MRFVAFAATLGLGLALWPALASVPKEKTKDTCGQYGTKVNFFESPSDAAAKAIKEEKLIFVLHVSGIFEDPRFT